ncbi:MAG: hypothetical protein SFY68_01320, partial [Candidatus Sumerlaeia bacterium]|nr:hypothetical protein [Candidatus Sumerlaeia bacterium]
MKKSFIALATTMAIHPVLGIAQAPVNLGEINPSTAVGSNPGFFTSLPNDRVVFFANEDSDGTFDVFGTDGTPQGTQKLKETAVVPAENFLAFSFGRLGDRVLFPVSGVNGLEIWSTDGTLQNTVRLAETNIAAGENAPAGPNQISANPADFRFFSLFNFTSDAGGLVTQELLFTAGTNATGVELWRTGGTPQTTNLVADMNPGTAGSFPNFLGAFGAGFSTDPAVYIAATTATQGREMFLSDGTSQGTVFLGDLEPGSVGVFDLPENDQKAFEIAALNAGTFFLENNTPQPDVFPLFTTANGYELWASQGTAQTTVLLGNINPGDGSSIVSESGDFAFEFDYVTNFTNLRSVLVFAATDGANGVELWRTNGTPSGTFLLKDFVTAPGVSGFGDQLLSLNQVNNNAVFLVNAPVSGLELWVTNGSQGGTNLLKDIIPGTGTPFQPNFFGLAPISISNPTTFIPSRLLFLATTPAEGTELWTTDGTTANTVILKDLSPGAASSFPVDTILASQPVLEFFNANKIALLADSTANGIELFITNGTPNNLDLLAEINTSGDAFPDLESLESVPFVSDSVTPVSQYLFAARQSTTGRELWITDGTTQNTKLVKDINPGATDGLVEGEGYLVGLRNATAFDDNQFWFIGKT